MFAVYFCVRCIRIPSEQMKEPIKYTLIKIVSSYYSSLLSRKSELINQAWIKQKVALDPKPGSVCRLWPCIFSKSASWKLGTDWYRWSCSKIRFSSLKLDRDRSFSILSRSAKLWLDRIPMAPKRLRVLNLLELDHWTWKSLSTFAASFGSSFCRHLNI